MKNQLKKGNRTKIAYIGSLVAIIILGFITSGICQKPKPDNLFLNFEIDPLIPTEEQTYSIVLNSDIYMIIEDEEESEHEGIAYEIGSSMAKLVKGTKEELKYAPISKESLKAIANARVNDIYNSQLVYANPDAANILIKIETSDITVKNVYQESLKSSSDNDAVVFDYNFTAAVKIYQDGELKVSEDVSPTVEETRIKRKDLILNPAFKTKMNLYENNPDKLNLFVEKFLNKYKLNVLYEALERAKNVAKFNLDQFNIRPMVMIYTAKGKYDYDQMDKAQEDFIDAVNSMFKLSAKKRISKEEGLERAKQSIVVWEEALKEENLEDKKARVNEKVSTALRINLAVGYLLLSEVENGYKYLDAVEISIPKENQGIMEGSLKDIAQKARKLLDQKKLYGDRFEILEF